MELDLVSGQLREVLTRGERKGLRELVAVVLWITFAEFRHK